MEASNHTPGAEPGGEARARTSDSGMRRSRKILWVVLAVLLAFLAGFGWQYLRASAAERQLAETERELRVERLRLNLAQAAIDAQTGEFETARSRMSELFNRAQADREEFPEPVRRVVDDLLNRRDEIITGLSRGTPEIAGTLFGYLDRLASSSPGTVGPAADTGG